MLIAKKGCVFDLDQLKLSNGYEDLDLIGKEAFVNHIHFAGKRRAINAEKKLKEWENEIKSKWKNKVFRIYRQIDKDEITLRFHLIRETQPNWADSGIEIIEIKT